MHARLVRIRSQVMLVLAYKMMEHPRVPTRVKEVDCGQRRQGGEDDRL